MSRKESLLNAEPDERDPTRFHEAQKVTWVSIVVNLALTLAQISIGLLTHAQSLVADGFHSLSDLVADFMVLFANYHSRHPADKSHPYGHHRIETAASLALGLLLAATGAAILWAAAVRLQDIERLPHVAPLALWAALATLAAKEGLFRYMLRVAERLRSPMLVANA
jgi:cation diffusion facilitator family transporter